jgi:serine/threonine-protein kinase RsbT
VPAEHIVREISVPVSREADVLVASQQGRAWAADLGLSRVDQAMMEVAISEVARNIVEHASRGHMILRLVQRNNQSGLVAIVRDQGPGIPDVSLAMKDGYSTTRGLGSGLPGAKRMVDEFEITSEVGTGTTIVMKKWKKTND